MSKAEMGTSFESQEVKELILNWARSRGINRGADFLRIAAFEYIRRKLPKKPVTVPLQRLRDIADGVVE